MSDAPLTADLVAPPAHAIDIGSGHAIEFVEYEGATAGINEYHLKADGAWCRGWVPFIGTPWSKEFEGNPEWQGWNVLAWAEILTLTPSIKCRACGNHGHITNGKWVPA